MNTENFLIKCRSKEHGKQIAKYIESLGFDISDFSWNCIGDYYGVQNGKVRVVLAYLVETNWNILPDIPKPELKPEDMVRGERYLFWDDDIEVPKKRIFISYIEGAKNPYLAVGVGSEHEYMSNQPFDTYTWKHAREIETTQNP